MNLFGKRNKQERIFLDHAGGKDNPSGIHKEGVAARKKLEDARAKIARILKCQAKDIIFTSGSTESDNLAMQGAVKAYQSKEKKIAHIIISDHEHPAIEETAKDLASSGVEVDILPVEKIVSAIKENTVLVSVVYANNETGAINNVPKLAREIKKLRRDKRSKFPYIHTDATQALELLPLDIERLGVDLETLGEVLIVRPGVQLRPLILGGGQERGLRAGTQRVSEAVEFAEHLASIEETRESESKRLNKLKKLFIKEVEEKIPTAVINTPHKTEVESLPNIVSITIPGTLHEFLAIKLDEAGVAVSTGSSCDSNKDEKDKEALRFSFGRETKENDIKEAIRILIPILL